MELFDILGPIMIGPSSSHTAGAARIGKISRILLGEKPVEAKVHLHGSFAETGIGHGTNLAIIGGLLGMNPDDLRIPFAFEEAEKEGLRFCFDTVELRDVHPNTAVLELTGEKGGHLTIQACSIGGGAIEVTALDGYEVSFTGNYNTLVIRNQDEFGTLAGVTTILSQFHINVGNMSLHRNKRGGDALMIIETDQHIKPSQVAFLGELPGIRAITYYDKEDEEYGFTLHR